MFCRTKYLEVWWCCNKSIKHLAKKSNNLMKSWARSASLVVQWLRICLPVQVTRVQALVWDGPTCRGATKPVRHNY